MMSGTVRQEAMFFGISVLTGCGLLWLYDILLLWRRWIPHRSWLVSLEDFVYWCACAGIIFALFFQKNAGILRAYAFVGILIGVWILGRIQRVFCKFWIKRLKKRKKTSKMAKSRDKGNH